MQKSRLVELAIKGLEAEKAGIDEELKALRGVSSGQRRTSRTQGSQEGQPSKLSPAVKPGRRMSAAARKKISEAMKRSHAARKAAAAAKK